MRLQLLTLKNEIEDALYNHDPLTGAGTRIGMLSRLRDLWELSKRQVQTCCIALMDLDHFKAVNDTRGHPVGDRVLAGVGRFLRRQLRPYDKVFRYGGEEFLIALPDCDAAAAVAVLERVREQLAAAPMAEDDGVPVTLTASFGVAELTADVPVEESLDRADAALYEAKAAGRNRTRAWTPR
jgi:diguanylate cyclase